MGVEDRDSSHVGLDSGDATYGNKSTGDRRATHSGVDILLQESIIKCMRRKIRGASCLPATAQPAAAPTSGVHSNWL
jgi:hypothetical protein